MKTIHPRDLAAMLVKFIEDNEGTIIPPNMTYAYENAIRSFVKKKGTTTGKLCIDSGGAEPNPDFIYV